MDTQVAISYLSNSILVLTALLAFLTLVFTFLLKGKKLNDWQFAAYTLGLILILCGIFRGLEIIYSLKNPLSESNISSISEYHELVGGLILISVLLFFYSFWIEKHKDGK